MSVSPPSASELSSLLEMLLREQQELTAAERFAETHSHATEHRQSRYYRHLLPAHPPGPGQQLAFEVDLDRCSGCKACVTACHSLNGLDQHETWRDVGLLIGGTSSDPVLQHVTAACHHCIDPACMSACPTLAYEKDPLTGIVKHLDDQCFGCQYCVLACPYDVPKYHRGKGIVRKCDMCSQRLQVGEAPACVQACPHEAIRINLVNLAEVIENAEATQFLPAAPDPQITLPTTTYRTRRVFPKNLLPADYHVAHVEEAHLPLIVMLVLTQLSVGAFFVLDWLPYLAQWWRPESVADAWVGIERSCQAGAALVIGLLALAASTLHLGRPHLAWRGVLGLRTSWLSREIVAFALFAAAAQIYATVLIFTPDLADQHPRTWMLIRIATLGGGALGVCCSMMIYHSTRRPTWVASRTMLRFLGTSLWLGLATVMLSTLIGAGIADPSGRTIVATTAVGFHRLGPALIGVATMKLLLEASDFMALLHRHQTPARRLATLAIGQLVSITSSRFAAGFLGGIVLPCVLWQAVDSTHPPTAIQCLVLTIAIFAMSVIGEFLERTLFFQTAVAPRMPGAIRP